MIKLKKLLIEGGNIKNVNSFVDNKYIEPTLKKVMRDTGLVGLKYSIVGNIKKPYSGDIDIALDWRNLLAGMDIPKEGFWKNIKIYLEKRNLKYFQIMSGLGQFSVVTPLIDNSGKHLNAITDRKGTEGKERGYVQVDFMIGNLKWMKKAHKTSDKSNYKDIYKKLFLVDILSNLIFKTKDPKVKRKLQINWKKGVQLVDFIEKDGKKHKIKVKTVTGDLDKFVVFLFGKGMSSKDIDSFEQLYSLFKTSKFNFPHIRKNIIGSFKNTLAKQKLPLPKEIK